MKTLDFTPLAGPLERASLAVARLDSRLHGHPLAAAWRHRSRLLACQRAAEADGMKADPDRLLALLLGLPLMERAQKDFGAEAACLRLLKLILGLYGEDGVPEHGSGDPEEALLAAAAEDALHALWPRTTDAPVLLHLGMGMLDLAMRGDVQRGAVVAAAPLLLHRRGVVAHLVPSVTGLPIVPADGVSDTSRWLALWLGRVETAANDGLDLLLTLSLRWGRWQRLIGKRRSTSRHAEALALACALPALSPAHLARTLGLTTRGASLICQELADLGCLVEVTGRRNYRLFVAVDQDGVAAVVAPRRPSLDQVVPVADPSARKPLSEFRFEPLPPLEIDFGPLFADVDIAMKAAQGAAKRGLDFLQEFHERRLREALAETDLPSEWDDPEEAA